MKKGPVFITIGDIVVDNFIKLESSNSHHVRESKSPITHSREICLLFGDKIPFDSSHEIPGVGNSANAAVSISRLGGNASIISTIGKDKWGDICIDSLKKEKVNIDHIERDKNKKTNYHFVLWYRDDRTILVKHEEYKYKIPKDIIKEGWIYLSSLGEHTLPFHNQIADYLDANPNVKLIFQPGTYQIKFGTDLLKRIYEKTELFFCNLEEAMLITKIQEKNPEKLLRSLKTLGPKHPIITDGHNGSYALIDDTAYLMPIYPDIKPPLERTGAGDSFASTFSYCYAKGMKIEDCLKWASINSMNVCQHIGAKEGLLDEDKIITLLHKAPKHWGIERASSPRHQYTFIKA